MRTIVGYVCVDEYGIWSVDLPQPDQGGGWGIGTVEIDNGTLEPTIQYLQAVLKRMETELVETIQARAKRNGETERTGSSS